MIYWNFHDQIVAEMKKDNDEEKRLPTKLIQPISNAPAGFFYTFRIVTINICFFQDHLLSMKSNK